MRLPSLVIVPCLAASVALAAPVRHHRAEENGPECLTAAQALDGMRIMGATAVRLDGEDAAAMLDAINRTGEPTSYAAPTLVVLLRPARVMIGLFGACHEGDVTMSVEGFRAAYVRMREAKA